METTTTIKTIEEVRKDITSEELEVIIMKGLGIKKGNGLSVSIDYDIRQGGYLSGVTITTRKVNEVTSET